MRRSTFAGLGIFCVGLVITAVGLGNKGYTSQHLQLLGPLCVSQGYDPFLQCASLSLVESFTVLLRQCVLCHKEPARRIQSPTLGAFFVLLAGSSWHKNSWLPSLERSYDRHPYALE